MIQQIDLKLFKCFENLKLPLGTLTVLSGTNASGKSSLLQALVLLHQTIKEHEWSTRLQLNGLDLKLGTVTDVVDKVNGRTEFSFSIHSATTQITWEFQGDRSDMSMGIKRIAIGNTEVEDLRFLHDLIPADRDLRDEQDLTLKLKKLTYITAERLGPREMYSLEDQHAATVVGPAGEHAHKALEEAVLGEFEEFIGPRVGQKIDGNKARIDYRNGNRVVKQVMVDTM